MNKNMEIQEFNPTKAEIQTAVEEVKNLTIKGIDDELGYEAVKCARKRLGDYRIKITKFGKEQREDAIKWQKEVLRQEKELLAMIEPTETKLKAELETIDEQKKIEERKVLLPARVKMLEEIEIKLSDAEILRMDEKEFSTYYTESKMAYLEEQDRKRKEEDSRNQREAELEQAKKEAAEKAVAEERARAEREREAEIKREKERQQEAEIAEAKKKEAERLEVEKAEKNRKYKAWVKQFDGVESIKIERDNNTFTAWQKVGEITIK